MSTNKRTARLAGFLWLIVCLTGIPAQLIRNELFITTDMAATAKNIMENELLFRLGFVSDIMMLIAYLLMGLVLYKLLCSVNKNLAALMVIFVVMGSTINMMNLLNEFKALHLLSGADYLKAFKTTELQAQALLSYDLYLHGYEIAHIFFSIWVLPLGILVYKSEFLPKVFGVLFIIQATCYVTGILIHFLFPSPELETYLQVVGIISEFSFLFWLIIRGINDKKINPGLED